MKTCTKCNVAKPLVGFCKNRQSKDGLHWWCRVCSAKACRDSYHRTPEKHREYYQRSKAKRKDAISVAGKKWKRANRDHVRQYQDTRKRLRQDHVYDYLLAHPCVDCGERDPLVLDFDHVRGIKRRSISALVCGNYEWSVILREIEKCDVRCANCHRRKTMKERGADRYLRTLEGGKLTEVAS